MTRQYATFDCGMWDDPDGFSALSAGAQRTYFMLVTQRDIAACGSLPLTLRRWARTCADKDVDLWLKELIEQRYLLVDEDTEEVLVRTFMRWDGGYKHSKRLLAVIASAKAIRSQSIRNTALAELAALGVPVATAKPIDPVRSVVTEVSTNHTPETGNREGEPGPLGDAEPPSPFCSIHPRGTEKACGPCGTAKLRAARWDKAAPAREAARKAAAQYARENCIHCHGAIWLEDGTKCTVHVLAEASA